MADNIINRMPIGTRPAASSILQLAMAQLLYPPDRLTPCRAEETAIQEVADDTINYVLQLIYNYHVAKVDANNSTTTPFARIRYA
jgi:hypothetical protein